ncbi:paired box' domain protein [Necator americanus]|uniref:Paired box' domain protein n=1 Tax=Necator americanus TaxID=51031 RepID=W2T3C8_NECAM|nr:paired box' domain protein [Necator americanus]ETN75736.1 paired box' domain protein [Necator americanus]
MFMAGTEQQLSETGALRLITILSMLADEIIDLTCLGAICYLESSLGDSPSSLSSTSLEDAPPPHTERDQAGWKICDISKRLCVTHSCVSKILNRYRQTGSVRPKDAKEGRTESPLVTAVRDYRTRLGMSRQGEIREQLIKDGICTRETAPSRSSINQ